MTGMRMKTGTTKTEKRVFTHFSYIGKQLPSDYKDFLKEYGGCYLESKKTSDEIEYDVCYKPIEKDPWMGKGDDTQLLEGFYGLANDHDSLQKAIDTYSDRFPEILFLSQALQAGMKYAWIPIMKKHCFRIMN